MKIPFYLLLFLIFSACSDSNTETPSTKAEQIKPPNKPEQIKPSTPAPILLKNQQALDKAQTELENQIKQLGQTTRNNLENNQNYEQFLTEHISSEDLDLLYNQEIQQPLHENLRSQHTRTRLGLLLNNEELSLPMETPYVFQSSEGEFLDKNKKLYQEFFEANPFHEQGLLARECGLKDIVHADQAFSQGNLEIAESKYKSALAMTLIVSGELPEGEPKTLYEKCTNKNLLTGIQITAN